MFRFSVAQKKLAGIHTNLLRAGVVEDRLFMKKVWDEFHRCYPEFRSDDPHSSGYTTARSLAGEQIFSVYGCAPQTTAEAREIIREKTALEPSYIWLGEEASLARFFRQLS